MTRVRRRLHRCAVATAALLILLAAVNVAAPGRARAGQPLYPDLRTATPSNLQLGTELFPDGRTHHVLRFDNVVENHGGRLEIVANLDRSRDIHQNVYDAKVGGNLVETRRVTADLIFHPTHNHFHVTDFARYALYKKSSSGAYKPTTRKGTKTSFCILDSLKVDPNATSNPGFSECTRSRQGLSAGWGDLYSAGLAEQWVDLGTRPLADGEYALHSTADPFNRIKETDDGNNTAVLQFKIQNGRIVGGGAQAPYCSAKPASASPGETIYVACDRLAPGEAFDIRWRFASGSPLATATVDEEGELHASFAMPPTARGARYVIVTATDASRTVRAVVEVVPSLALQTASGAVGDRIGFTIQGFNPNERVMVSYEQLAGVWKTLATVTTDGAGSASGVATIPSSSAGEHRLKAQGDGGAPATATFLTVPTLRLSATSAPAGAAIQPTLRGFGNRERVDIRLVETGAVLRTVTVSSTGAASPSSTTEFVVPASLVPGPYTIRATGRTSGIQASVPLTVTGVQATAETPTPAATTEPSATAEPTAAPEPAVTPEPTTAPLPEPTATPEPPVDPTAPAATAEAAPAQDEPAP